MPSRQDHLRSFGGSMWGVGGPVAPPLPPPWQPPGSYHNWGYHNQQFLKWRTWAMPAGGPFAKGYDASQFVSWGSYIVELSSRCGTW